MNILIGKANADSLTGDPARTGRQQNEGGYRLCTNRTWSGDDMKKLLKKANRGILLTVFVLIAVSIYLITSAFMQAAEKPQIEKICRDYTAAEISYMMLPERWRTGEEPMPQEEIEAYKVKMQAEIEPWYIDNQRIRDLALNRLDAAIDDQTAGMSKIIECTKEIARFESFSFSGNEVTVVFKSRTAVDRSKSEYEEGGRIVEETSDTIMLQKEDGKWKLVYASLWLPSPNYGPYAYSETAKW